MNDERSGAWLWAHVRTALEQAGNALLPDDYEYAIDGEESGMSDWRTTEWEAIEIISFLRRQDCMLRDCRMDDDQEPRYRLFQYGNCLGYATRETVEQVMRYFQLSGFLDG